MDTHDVKRLAYVLAKQAEVEGMKAANTERESRGESLAYPADSFFEVAEELRHFASCHDSEL